MQIPKHLIIRNNISPYWGPKALVQIYSRQQLAYREQAKR